MRYLAWLNPELGKRAELVASVTINAVARGYSLANVFNLIRQSNNETGNGNDYKFTVHNNAWGMMRPSWSTRAIGSIGTEGQAIYKNVNDGTLDRLDWDRRNGITGREVEYLAMVQDKGYNPNPMYPVHVGNFDPLRASVIRVLVALPLAFVVVLYSFKNI